jgi:hypothetical protein
MAAKQPRPTLRGKPFATPLYKAIDTVEFVADQSPGPPRIQQQYQSRTPGLIGPAALTIDSLGEFFVFHSRQVNRVAREYDCTLVSDVTVH